jgi:hypothetical protein
MIRHGHRSGRSFVRTAARVFGVVALTLMGALVTHSVAAAAPLDAQLQLMQIPDSSGSPIANATITVEQVPIDVTAWGDNAWSQVGYGSSDSNGYLQVPIDSTTTAFKNPAAYHRGWDC